MKSPLTVFVLVVVLLNILSGCAPGTNQFKGTASEHDVVAGFWLGLWQGLLRHLCLWPRFSKATSVSTRSTTTEPGTTSAICSAWRASLAVAATGRQCRLLRPYTLVA
jgi:hypothetical protein